jgi:hypothetical protein
MNPFDKLVAEAVDCDYFDQEVADHTCPACEEDKANNDGPHAIAIACTRCTSGGSPQIVEFLSKLTGRPKDQIIDLTSSKSDVLNVLYYRGALILRCATCKIILVTVKVR